MSAFGLDVLIRKSSGRLICLHPCTLLNAPSRIALIEEHPSFSESRP